MRRPEVLYHLATVTSGSAAVDCHAAAFGRTLGLLEAARQHGIPKVVVAVPATAIYGRPAARDLPIKERELEPRGVRGVVARSIVDLLVTYREQYAVEFTVLAMASAYGPRQRPDGGVVAAFAAAAVDGTRRHESPVTAARPATSSSSTTSSMRSCGRASAGVVSWSTSGRAHRRRCVTCGRSSPGRPRPSRSTGRLRPTSCSASRCRRSGPGSTWRGRRGPS